MREPTAEPRPKFRRALPLQRTKMQHADMQRQTMHTMYSHTACSSHDAADPGSRLDVCPLADAALSALCVCCMFDARRAAARRGLCDTARTGYSH